MLPVVPLLSWGSIIAGFLGVTYYASLSQAEQEEADRLAAKLAAELYSTTVDRLSSDQLNFVTKLVKNRLN
ncbi:MAG TPA: hypothetical protein VM165_15580 [Planctomycetaceae bacterium]|nr:hypothetical protein [Planctomycetaceae bacterium]